MESIIFVSVVLGGVVISRYSKKESGPYPMLVKTVHICFPGILRSRNFPILPAQENGSDILVSVKITLLTANRKIRNVVSQR